MSTSAEPRLIARGWIDSRVDEWRRSADPVLLIVGTPGSGKTVAMSSLARADDVLSTHFCRARDDRLINPLRLIEQLAGQIAATCPAFRDELVREAQPGTRITVGDVTVSAGSAAPGSTVAGVVISLTGMSAREAFDRSIRRPWDALDDADRPAARVVLVDALDEALPWPGAETIVDLMAAVAAAPPEGMRFVLSSRPRMDVVERFPAVQRFDLDGYPEKAREDVYRLVAASRPEGAAALVRAANGNLLVAYHMLRTPELRVAAGSTVGLPEMYAEFIDRELRRDGDRDRWRQRLRPILALLGVARGPGLTVPEAALLTGLPRLDTRDALRDLGSFVQVDPDGRWHVFHESFRDFLAADEDIDAGPAQNLAVAERMIDLFPHWRADDLEYAVATVVAHLVTAADGDPVTARQARRLLDALVADARWLVRRAVSDGVDELLADLGLAGARSDPARSVTGVVRRQAAQIRAAGRESRIAQQLALGALSMGVDGLRDTARTLAAESGEPWVDGVWARGPGLDPLRLVVPAHARGIRRVGIAGDHTRLVSVGESDHTAVLWDASTGFALLTCTDVVDAAVAWTRDLLYAVGRDGTVHEWDLADRSSRVVLPGVTGDRVEVAPDGSRLVVMSADRAHVVDTAGWTVRATLPVTGGDIVFTPDLRIVMSVQPGHLTCLDPDGVSDIGLERGYHPDYGTSVGLSADGRVVAWSALGEDFSTEVWACDVSGRTRPALLARFEPPARVCLNADGSRLLVFTEDGRLHIIDPRTGAELVDRAVPNGFLHTREVLPTGVVVGVSSTGGFYQMPLDGGGADVTLPVSAGVSALSVSPDGRFGVTGGPDGNLQLWELPPVGEHAATPETTSFVRVPGTGLVWTTDTAGVLRLVDTVDGSVRDEHKADAGTRVHACAPDGSAILIATDAYGIVLDTGTGAESRRLELADIKAGFWCRTGPMVVARERLSCRLYDGTGRPWPTAGLPVATDYLAIGADRILLMLMDAGTVLHDALSGSPLMTFPVGSHVINSYDGQDSTVSGDGRRAVMHTPDGPVVIDLGHGGLGDAGAWARDAPIALDHTGDLLLAVAGDALLIGRPQDDKPIRSVPAGAGLALIAVSPGESQRAAVSTTAGDLLACGLRDDAAIWSAWMDVAFDRVEIFGDTVLGIDDSGRLVCLRLV